MVWAPIGPTVSLRSPAGPVAATVEVDGRVISYATMGEGDEVVVLVHGYGGDKNSWLFVQEPLSRTRTVHAIDLPGHGESAKDVGDGSLDTLAATVLGFLGAVGAGRAHLVGHSLGGAVVTEVAAAAPDRVSALTLVSPAGFGAVDAAYLRGFAEAGSRRELRPRLGKLFADESQVNRQLIDDLPEPETREGTVKIKVDWCGICGTDLHEYLEGPIFTPAEAPHPLTGERNPVQLGHEFAGHVTEVGRDVTGFAEGDAVTVEPTLFCGECAGIPAVLTTALHAVKRTGTVVNVAIWGAPTQIHLNDLVFSEAYLTGIIGYLGDHPATIGLLADDLIDVGFFITKRIKLDELVDGGFHELIQNKDEHVKVLVQP